MNLSYGINSLSHTASTPRLLCQYHFSQNASTIPLKQQSSKRTSERASIPHTHHARPPSKQQKSIHNLPITLRHPLQLILLLDRIRIRTPLRRINQFLRKTLRDTLDIPEARLAGSNREQSDRLIDASERGYINCLTTHSTC